MRSSFTLIELTLSIVVVGLVILSIPLIVRQTSVNTVESQNVMGYYNALSLMETIRKKPWDKNNVADFEKSGDYYILYTDDAPNNCKKLPGSNVYGKNGLSNADNRRLCDPLKKKASAIKADGKLDSINSFKGYTQNIVNNNNKVVFKLVANVEYVNINFNNGNITTSNRTTDVKKITVSLQRVNPDGKAEVISNYIYYATNIGTNIPITKDNS